CIHSTLLVSFRSIFAVPSTALFRSAQHVLYSSWGYLVPRRDGRILAGSTTEFVGFEKDVTIDGVSEIMAMALEIAPLLDDSALVDRKSTPLNSSHVAIPYAVFCLKQ